MALPSCCCYKRNDDTNKHQLTSRESKLSTTLDSFDSSFDPASSSSRRQFQVYRWVLLSFLLGISNLRSSSCNFHSNADLLLSWRLQKAQATQVNIQHLQKPRPLSFYKHPLLSVIASPRSPIAWFSSTELCVRTEAFSNAHPASSNHLVHKPPQITNQSGSRH